MRFLVDPDGLINLLDAYTTRFSPVQAREALHRFERLMRSDLNNPKHAPYLSFHISKTLGSEYYSKRLSQLCEELTCYQYSVPINIQPKAHQENLFFASIRKVHNLTHNILSEPHQPNKVTLNWPRSKVKVPKYFQNREQLIGLLAEFVDDLFLNVTHANGKITWCEKTPQNIFHVDFLWELFPKSVVIHVIRDPRGVAYSVMNQAWGPNNLKDVCIYLQSMYDRWFDIVNRWDLDKYRYLEVKLEDLGLNPLDVLKQISLFCGLKNTYEALPRISIDKVNYWKDEFNSNEMDVLNQELGKYIVRFGYKV
jgi:hypothetical protein